MFTILHRDRDGTEALYTASRVHKVHTGDRFSDGIYLDGEPNEKTAADVSAPVGPVINAKHCIRFAECGSTDDFCQPMVFVMNAAGATVARYSL